MHGSTAFLEMTGPRPHIPLTQTTQTNFFKFGSGVLITIRSDIQADIKRLSVRKGAEILAIEVSIDGKKFVFCNLTMIAFDYEHYKNILRNQKTQKKIIVGDFNLKRILWPRSKDMGNGNGTDEIFIDSFNGFGLDQCISGPTHN